MLRPLSQTGFIRVPQNPNQRPINPATGLPVKRTKLRKLNAEYIERGFRLHPTKGFRKA